MAKKMIAVFLMCIVVVAALQISMASVEDKEAKFDARFKSCYENCEKECVDKGNGQSFCEVKCDEDCDVKEVADKLHIDLDEQKKEKAENIV